jgi:peroxiredoxin
MDRLTRMIILTSIVLAGLAIASCSSNSAPAPAQPLQEGVLAPDFQLQSLDGQAISLSSLQGRPVLLNFWATWCGPCQVEMPYIQEVSEDKDWVDQGLVILGINIGEESSDVEKFMEDNSLFFPVLLDTDATVAKAYNVRGIPTTFFIDKNGIIKDMKIGTFPTKADIDWRLINSILDGE